MFKQRIGPDPHEGGKRTSNVGGCPDVWELQNGDVAVIGLEKTHMLMPHLPETAGCGPDENIVVVPRDLLLGIKEHIPNK